MADVNYLQEVKEKEKIKASVTNSNNHYLDNKIDNVSQNLTDVLSSNNSNFQSQLLTNLNVSRPIGQPIFRLGDTLNGDEIRLEGQIVSRKDYSALFNVYGTTFGAGDGSTTFQLPDFRNRTIWGATEIGTVEAGLPNITGNFTDNGNWSHYGAANGAFSKTSTGVGSNQGGASDGGWCNFNASRSNGIYGNSSTVQPPAIKVRVVTRYK